MNAPTSTLSAPDVRRRVRPSREQLRIAAAMFAVASEDVTSVVVPIVVSEPSRVEYPGGYWLADRSVPDGSYGYLAAREAAEAAAEAHVRDHGGRGVPGWVSIRTDGTWAAFDGLATAV